MKISMLLVSLLVACVETVNPDPEPETDAGITPDATESFIDDECRTTSDCLAGLTCYFITGTGSSLGRCTFECASLGGPCDIRGVCTRVTVGLGTKDLCID